jgi:hypothetical protein
MRAHACKRRNSFLGLLHVIFVTFFNTALSLDAECTQSELDGFAADAVTRYCSASWKLRVAELLDTFLTRDYYWNANN